MCYWALARICARRRAARTAPRPSAAGANHSAFCQPHCCQQLRTAAALVKHLLDCSTPDDARRTRRSAAAHDNTRLPPRNRNRVPRPAQHSNQGLLPLHSQYIRPTKHARLRRVSRRARVPARRFKRCTCTWIKGRRGLGLRGPLRNIGVGPQELLISRFTKGLPDHAGEDAARAFR